MDIGAVEAQFSGPAPVVAGSPQVGDGAAQRSRLTSVALTFNAVVTLPADPTQAFTLTRISDGAVVTIGSVSVDNSGGASVVTVGGFGGAATSNGSLADGRYRLTALASQVTANGQTMAGDFVFA